MRIIQFVVLALAPTVCLAQSFIIDDAESYADFSFRKDDKTFTCFYKTWNSDKKSSHYRTISFDGNLDVTDTISYRLNGVCSTLGSEENGKYSYHIFYAELPDKQTIRFLVTDKSGKTIATYEKTADDIKLFFKKGFKKLSELRFENIKTDGQDAGLLVLRPSLYSKSGLLRVQGNWIALNLLDGTLRWQMEQPVTFVKSKTAAGKLITLQTAQSGHLFVHYYDVRTGRETASTPLHTSEGNRTVSVFEVDSVAVILAGGEFGNRDGANKHARFFLSRFDLSGHQVFDRVDTTERLSNNRLQLLGGTIGSAGDLILVGESYKVNATAMVARTAASVLLIILGSPIIPGSGNVQKIVQGIVTVRISANGDVKEFNSFPVAHRTAFSSLIKDDRQIYLRYKDQLWLYDLSDLSSPPRLFKTILQEQDVVIFSGNLIGIRKDDEKKEIILEKIFGL